ncbi:probable palmitoyltransferase ZDHHC11B [Pteropus vampyrus]|uniref:Palmitoyltransferase n=1 Tax=Pteropus vampyrus TaxID=132908 RepID=A0A6P6BKA6_PTEVA|nr:probable palmitoyltransferase ZDHHC11B [Pteropus vampyrus]
MGCCVRAPSPVSPEGADKKVRRTVPPRVPRANGWSLPLHPFQVMSWVMFLVLAFTIFFIFIPLLPHVWKLTAYGVTGGCFFLYLIVHLVAVSVDPAEASVRHRKSYRQEAPSFDRSKQPHVIQNRFCCLCRVAVGPKTKHCSACNKCVAGFDHHCKWLNNCVGSRNYWFFLSSVALALAGLLCVAAILTCVFVQYVISPMWLRSDPSFRVVTNVKTWLLFLPFAPMKTKASVLLGIGVFVALLTLSGLVVLGHLLIFHLYLST